MLPLERSFLLRGNFYTKKRKRLTGVLSMRFKYQCVSTFMSLFPVVFAYTFKCPVAVNWILRAQIVCMEQNKYTCLYDDNNEQYKEMCKTEQTFPAGHKAVIRDFIDIAKCSHDRYQPLYFLTNGQSRCSFEKSRCSDEGQILSNNGTQAKDVSCVCNERLGYSFVENLSNQFCLPSLEDCSCFKLTNTSDVNVLKTKEEVRMINGSLQEKTILYYCSEFDDTTSHLDLLYSRKACIGLISFFTIMFLLLLPLMLKPDIIDLNACDNHISCTCCMATGKEQQTFNDQLSQTDLTIKDIDVLEKKLKKLEETFVDIATKSDETVQKRTHVSHLKYI